MKDRTGNIFSNPISKKTIRKAEKSKKKYIQKFGDDSKSVYHLKSEPIESLEGLGIDNLVFSDAPLKLDDKAVIVGNIRMGFGHYRISIAMASCAKALGYHPYWLDLASFDATGSKMIRYQNNLYSLASRISQKSRLFNHFIWEPLNSEGFRKLDYNAIDQKNSELLVPLFHDIPKDTPYIATHVWPSQAAIHSEMTHVVNAIPDNWPMALHLSEGAIHTVQTPFAYLGYKMLNGMDKKRELKGLPNNALHEVGCYVDHELVSNIEIDNEKRRERIRNNEPVRFLITVGGAGAGAKQFASMIKHLLPYVREKKATLFINFGDHKDMYEYLVKKVSGYQELSRNLFNEYDKVKKLASGENTDEINGIYSIYHENIFQAVYSTNLLMRVSDLLITKPSELVFYPIPKIFMKHVGGHEAYGGVHGQEVGDATFECPTEKDMNRIIDRMIQDKDILVHFTYQIEKLGKQGYYNGGYEVVKLAVKK